jgi:hypothetical protein
MMIKQFDVRFVEFIPENIQDGVIYVSIECVVAIHKCACGCGQKVVTPFTPTDWKLTYDGETISLNPSIGNWSYPCRSHYIIHNSSVVWAKGMSSEMIALGRQRDKRNKAIFYNQKNSNGQQANELDKMPSETKSGGLLRTIARFFGFK